MATLKIVLAILGMLIGMAGTLMFVVFLLAATANSKPEEAHRVFRWCWVIGAGGAGCLAISAFLLWTNYPVNSALVGAFPLAAFVLFLLVAAILT